MYKIKFCRHFVEVHRDYVPVTSLFISPRSFVFRLYDRRGYVVYTLTLWDTTRNAWTLHEGHRIVWALKHSKH